MKTYFYDNNQNACYQCEQKLGLNYFDKNKPINFNHKLPSIISIDEFLNPVNSLVVTPSALSIESYTDENQTYSMCRSEIRDDYRETLHFSKELMFSVDVQRHFTQPVNFGLLQKGYIRFMCILAGRVEIDGPNDKHYVLQPQDCLISRYGNSPVNYKTAEPQFYTAVELIVLPDALLKLAGLSLSNCPIPFRKVLNPHLDYSYSLAFKFDSTLAQLLADIIKPTNDPAFLRQLFLKSKLMAFVNNIFRQLYDVPHMNQQQVVDVHALDTTKLNAVRQLIEMRIATPPSMNELCLLAGSNENKLSFAFKQLFGKTPYQYGLDRRLQEALRLLKSGRYSVAEVAFNVGYQEPNSFSRVFRSRFGKAPKQI